MGDCLSPNRRDILERIRRRFEVYRRHQARSHSWADPHIDRVSDQQRQQTDLLRQRWLESKNRRSSKSSSKRSEANSGGQVVPSLGAPGASVQAVPNQLATLNKRDHTDTHEQVYNFDKSESQVPGGGGGGAEGLPGGGGGGVQSSSVSVDINVHHARSSQIKVTVNTRNAAQTPAGSGGAVDSTLSASSTTSTTIHTSTDICKQEPGEDSSQQQNPVSNASQNSCSADSLGLEDVEEILIAIEKGEGADLIKEFWWDNTLEAGGGGGSGDMVKDEQGLNQTTCANNNSTGVKDSGPAASKKDESGVMFADAVYDTSAPPVTQQAYPSGGGAAAQPYNRPVTSTPNATGGGGGTGHPPLLGDTGPAAEALKQMAAHRQSREQSSQYEMKAGAGGMPPPPYTDGYTGDPYRVNTPGGYPGQYPPAGPQYNMGAGQYGYSTPPTSMAQGKPDYNATKRLTHYSETPTAGGAGTSNSLQQLQNQVQSHFSQAQQGPQPGPSPGPGPPSTGQAHIQITQNQHMQLTQGGVQHMHVSQTQQMHIQGQSAPVSVAQHQSFHMSTVNQNSGGPGGDVSSSSSASQQQPHYPVQQMYRADKMSSQREHTAMDAYANRPPPPEYKMPQNYGGSSMRPNPLQTMQNMVNQTSQQAMPGGGGGGGMFMKTEMGAQCQQPGPTRTASPMSLPASQAPPAGYMGQQGVPNGTVASRPTKVTNPTYTSAIMRGQRPPNVNVGPEGLNISHQRGEWTRMMGPQAQMGMMGQTMSSAHMATRQPQMGGPQMMGYNRYPPSSQQMTSAGVQGQHMQISHQQVHRPSMAGPPPHPMAGGGPRQPADMHHVRMSQQQIAMQSGGHGMSGMAMTQTASIAATPSQHAPPPNYHPSQHDNNNPRNGGPDFPALEFLDSGPGGNPDFFDAVGGASTDFNFIDDILGNK